MDSGDLAHEGCGWGRRVDLEIAPRRAGELEELLERFMARLEEHRS